MTNKYPQFWPTHIHNLTKLRHLSVESKFGQSLVGFSTGLRHWGCRSLVSKFGRHLIENLDVKCVSFIYRTNFDQTSTLGVSRFCRSLVEVSTKLRHQQICTILTKPYMYNYDPWIFIIYQIIFIAWIKQNMHFYQAIFTILSKIYTQFWSTNICTILFNKYSQFWPLNN